MTTTTTCSAIRLLIGMSAVAQGFGFVASFPCLAQPYGEAALLGVQQIADANRLPSSAVACELADAAEMEQEGDGGRQEYTCSSTASCYVPHAGPGCNNVCCCQAVCATLGYCCEVGADWDAFCANQANSGTLPACASTPGLPTVSFSGAPYTQAEGGAAIITVSISACYPSAVSISYATSDGTAVAGSDYLPASGTFTWTAGDTGSRTFAVSILADGVPEPSETVILTLSSPVSCSVGAPNPTTLTILDVTTGAVNNLVVSSLFTNSVIEYRWPGGNPVGTLVPTGSGGLSGPRILRFGRGRDLFVPSSYTSSVIRYNGANGTLIGTFIGLDAPYSTVFGQAWAPDGNDVVINRLKVIMPEQWDCAVRYSGTTGELIGEFQCYAAPGGSAPLNFAFRPNNGNILVSHFNGDQVQEFTYPAGDLVRTYSGGGLDGPEGLVIGPNGNLFVCSAYNDKIVQFNTTTGALVGDFVTSGSGGLGIPIDLAFGPDGNLYVSSAINDSVLRYNGTTRASMGAFVSSGSGGLNGPGGIAFRPPMLGDADGDGDVDLADYEVFVACFLGPDITPSLSCETFDFDEDGDVDLADYAVFAFMFTGALP